MRKITLRLAIGNLTIIKDYDHPSLYRLQGDSKAIGYLPTGQFLKKEDIEAIIKGLQDILSERRVSNDRRKHAGNDRRIAGER